MPLFNCAQCNAVENTATGAYWGRKMADKPALCSECDTGTWHGLFAKKSAAGMLVASDGFLWSSAENAPRHVRIVGTVDERGAVVPLAKSKEGTS